MPDLVYYVAVSLDGFIAAPDGGVEWLAAYERPGEDYGYADFYAGVDALVLGRRTYDQVMSFGSWPYAGKPCWVLSSRHLGEAPAGVTGSSASPEEVMADLDNRDRRRVWLVGGAKLAASFRAAGLITEYIVTVTPVLLGGGVPLVAAPGPRERLRLVATEIYAGGLVQLRYVGSGPGG